MQLFLSGLAGQDLSTIEAGYDTTIGDLRRMVRESHCFGPNVSVSLILGETEILASMDTLTLADCHIGDGITLTVIKRHVAKVSTASSDRTAKIWSTNIGECIQTLTRKADLA